MLVDLSTRHSNIGFIDNDSYSGSRAAARHLLSLGHRAIGYLAGKESLNHLQRFRGYCDAMHEAGLEIPDHWIQDRDPDELKTDIHHGAGMLSRLRSMRRRNEESAFPTISRLSASTITVSVPF